MKNVVMVMCVLLLVVGVNADVVDPGTITAVASQEGYGGAAMNAVNGAGLSGPSGPDQTHNAAQWQAFQCGFSTPGQAVTLDINLNAVYQLSDMYVWNYNGNSPDWAHEADTGWYDMKVEYSVDGVNYDFLSDNIVPINWPGDPEYGVWPFHKQATIDLAGITAQYIRLTNTQNWATAAQTGGNQNYRILSEVAFEVVPEPASMMLLGLGSLALIRKRR